MKTVIKKDGKKFIVSDALYEAIQRNGLIEATDANPTNAQEATQDLLQNVNPKDPSIEKAKKVLQQYKIKPNKANIDAIKKYLNNENLLSQAIQALQQQNSKTSKTASSADSGDEGADGQESFDFSGPAKEIKEAFVNKLRTEIVPSISRTFTNERRKIQREIGKYKAEKKNNSKKEKHFLLFDDVFKKYFSLEGINNNIESFIKKIDTADVEKLINNINSKNQTVILNRGVLTLLSIYCNDFKKEINNIVQDQINEDDDLPAEYVKNTIERLVGDVFRACDVILSRQGDFHTVEVTTEEERETVWDKLKEEIESIEEVYSLDKPIKIYLTSCITIINYIETLKDNYVDNVRRDGANKTEEIDRLTKQYANDSLKQGLYNIFINYKKARQLTFNYVDNFSVTDENINEVLSNAGNIRESQKKNYDDSYQKSKAFIEKILKYMGLHKKIRESVEKDILLEKRLKDRMSDLTWFATTLNDINHYYTEYDYNNKKDIEASLKVITKMCEKAKNNKSGSVFFGNFFNAKYFLEGIFRHIDDLNKNYPYSELSKKFTKIFNIKLGDKAIKDDPIVKFENLMGRYPNSEDIKEYEEVYKTLDNNIQTMKSIINKLRGVLGEEHYYEPMDYHFRYLGNAKTIPFLGFKIGFEIKPDSPTIAAIEGDKVYGAKIKKFLNKCFAYLELSNVPKDSNFRKIADDIVGDGTHITQKKLEKLFVGIYLNNKNLSQYDIRNIISNSPALNSYQIGYSYDSGRFSRNTFMNLLSSEGGESDYIGTVSYISQDKFIDLIKNITNLGKNIGNVKKIPTPK